jgi:GNAT superfamily N-acetyltransferase
LEGYSTLTDNEYQISTDKSLLSVERISYFLSQTYWAQNRTREQIELTIANSLCYGLYHEGQQVGFARVVTDGVAMFWLGDVFIDPKHRGKGLGKKLVQHIIESPELRGLGGLLATRDAHSLYEQFGFYRDPERLMKRPPQ